MEWIRDMVDLSNITYKNKETSNLIMKTENDVVKSKSQN